MSKGPIAWFEIVVEDFDRACEFYSQAFNITFKKEINEKIQMAVFPYEEGQIGGSLMKMLDCKESKPGHGGIYVYLTCQSVSQQLDNINQYGGKTIFPVTSIGDNGFIAGFEDSEGNFVGLWSMEA